jgi:hypothetical protein
MATIAVFAALGGGAYAAATVTGRDVVDRTGGNTGSRRSGRPIALPVGLRHNHDGVGPTEWLAMDTPGLERTNVDANRVEFSINAASGLEFLALEPTLPVSVAGKPLRLLAATLCVNAVDPAATLNGVFVGQFRSPPSNVIGASAQVAQLSNATIRHDSACRRYVPQQPFVLLPGDYVNVRLRFSFSAAAEVYVGASSFELAPA